jgi:hypothetical protein
VPLRPAHTNDDDKASVNPLWAPLGKRVRLLAWRNNTTSQHTDRDSRFGPMPNSSERAPLINTVLRPSANGYGSQIYDRRDWRSDLFTADHDEHDDDDEGDRADRARLNREIDLFFGPWPQRLLNSRVSLPFPMSFILLTPHFLIGSSGGGGISSPSFVISAWKKNPMATNSSCFSAFKRFLFVIAVTPVSREPGYRFCSLCPVCMREIRGK